MKQVSHFDLIGRSCCGSFFRKGIAVKPRYANRMRMVRGFHALEGSRMRGRVLGRGRAGEAVAKKVLSLGARMSGSSLRIEATTSCGPSIQDAGRGGPNLVALLGPSP